MIESSDISYHAKHFLSSGISKLYRRSLCYNACYCFLSPFFSFFAEPVKVDIVFKNPLQIPISISSVSLICDLSPKSDETESGTSNLPCFRIWIFLFFFVGYFIYYFLIKNFSQNWRMSVSDGTGTNNIIGGFQNNTELKWSSDWYVF